MSGETRTVPVSIADPACGRFTATVISGFAGPSPEWMARRLEALGMRAINNVVDVSNYVMLELGQPNHAYDLSTIGGGFSVRMARDGETLTTLDDVERSCTVDDLLICDGNDVPVGLGGVMGGADSEISDSTTEVVLEIAWFAPLGIMKTASRHGLRSEASARYERGVDPTLADRAVQRFAELLLSRVLILLLMPVELTNGHRACLNLSVRPAFVFLRSIEFSAPTWLQQICPGSSTRSGSRLRQTVMT